MGAVMEKLDRFELLDELQRQAGTAQKLLELTVFVSAKGVLAVSMSVACPLMERYGCEPIVLSDLQVGLFRQRQGDVLYYNANDVLRWNEVWPEGSCQNCGNAVKLSMRLVSALLKNGVIPQVAAAYVLKMHQPVVV